jgi:predicted dehydrogenase
MEKGKAVYCEKPMVQYIEEGPAVVETQQRTKKAFQVGSQFASSLAHIKAREFYAAGEIGQMVLAEAYFDRYDALGAWQYSIPPDASAETCDWKMFQGDATDLPFSAERFFHWRNYRDYGTGIPGDLFVHLFTMLHNITGAIGPERIYATGGLRYWEDGRDVADVMMGLYDYPKTEKHPAFNLGLRVNFVDGSGGRTGIRIVGSEGEMDIGWNSVTVRRNKLPKAPGYGGWDTFGTFPEATQKEFEKEYKKKYADVMNEKFKPTEETYTPPEDYGGEGMRRDHFADFFNAMRTGEETVEGAVFGLRAAGPALASNTSHYEKRVVYWDAENMQEVSDKKAMGERE